MRKLATLTAVALAAAAIAAGCGGGDSSSSSPLGNALGYLPADSPFAIAIDTDPDRLDEASDLADKAQGGDGQLDALLKQALGDRTGIDRYGFAYAPLDEALARVVIDCSGRPFLDYHADFPEAVIGRDFAASLVEEFWRSLAVNAGLTVHIDLLRARNSHHAAEAIFKAGAVALRTAIRRTEGAGVPSTKGLLA